MKRVVADGGRLIIIGPTGPAAAAADAKVLSRWRARGDHRGVVEWLSEREQLGLPSVDDLVGYLKGERVQSVCVRGVFNVQLWWLMHRALLGDFPARARPMRGSCSSPTRSAWWPVAGAGARSTDI